MVVNIPPLNCPLCGSTDKKKLVLDASHIYKDFDAYIVSCPNCSFKFTYLPANQTHASSSLYNDEYDCYAFNKQPVHLRPFPRKSDSFDIASGVIPSVDFLKSTLHRNRFVSLPLAFLKGRFRSIALSIPLCYPKNSTMLDIGCGNGSWIRSMYQNHFTELYAQDINNSALKHLTPYCRAIYFMDVPSLANLGTKYDLIRLNQVLEHINDPIDFLLSIKNICHENSIVIITVPSMTCVSAVFRSFYTSLMIPYHLNHFTPHTLQALLDHVGFNSHLRVTRAIPEVFLDSLSLSLSILLSAIFRTNRLYFYTVIKKIIMPLTLFIAPFWLLLSFFGFSEEIEVAVHPKF
jgi:SAM-dependent methyltransferase